jgi:Zn-dependent protease with chaperone function
MDRELVLGILISLLCGSALVAAGSYPNRASAAASGRALERDAWRRMWLPFAPAVLVLAALCGWALEEPASAERVPNCLVWSALPFAAVFARAAWRAIRSLRSWDPGVAVATVGLFRPRVVLSPQVAAALDPPALAAALAHERAHSRHHDPLRLWLGQLGSDLLWPWPAAAARLRCWRQALELARDDEARLDGVAGPDLAAAILVALRSGQRLASTSAATLGADEYAVGERIARLLRPITTETAYTNDGTPWFLALAVGVLAAMLLGTEFGERAVRTLLAVGG